MTDLRNPYKPKVYDKPIDLWRNDGATDYSHDVNVDDHGIAWTSGRGGILGYATKGLWRDPYTDKRRWARPWKPVLVAGGGVGGVNQPQTDFMHNSLRPVDGSTRAEGVRRGGVLIGTEEDFTEPCAASGRVVFSDITDSVGGEPAANSTPEQPVPHEAARHLPSRTGRRARRSIPASSCSAHYFELSESTLGVAWYGQGLRLLDVSDARDVRQIGYYRVTGSTEEESSNSWDLAWNGRYVYLFDMNRGIEVLELKSSTKAAAVSRLRTVRAPAAQADPYAPGAGEQPEQRRVDLPGVQEPIGWRSCRAHSSQEVRASWAGR